MSTERLGVQVDEHVPSTSPVAVLDLDVHQGNGTAGTTPQPVTPSYGTTNYAAETPATGYADAGYADAGYAGTTTGYAAGTTGSVPPPPYGTAGTSDVTGGFDDPARTSGQGRL